MTFHQGQLQTLINEIEALLGKATPRLPRIVAGEANQQRRVLEQARDYLQRLQTEGQAPAGWGPLSPETGDIMPAAAPPPPPLETSSQQILQALLQEMQYLRSQTLQPLRSEVSLLQQQREQLLQEVRQLELERLQLAGNPPATAALNPALVDEVVQRLQEGLFSQLNPQIQALKAQVNDPAALYGTGEGNPTEPGDLPQLHPSQRLEQLRRVQAQTDYLLLKLDTNLRVVFESMEQSIQSYRDSLHQGLDTMHGLGQQGEVIFKALINHLAQQLGQAPYLDTTVRLDATARDRAARLSAAEDRQQQRYGLDAVAEVLDSGDRWGLEDDTLAYESLDTGLDMGTEVEDEDLPSWPEDLDLDDEPLDIDDLDLDDDLSLEGSEEVTLFQLDEEFTQLQLDEPMVPEGALGGTLDEALEDDDAFFNDRFDEDTSFQDDDEATVIQREPIPWPVAIGQRPAPGTSADTAAATPPPPEEDHAEIDALYASLFGTVDEPAEGLVEELPEELAESPLAEPGETPAVPTEAPTEATATVIGEINPPTDPSDGETGDRPHPAITADDDLDRSLDEALLEAPSHPSPLAAFAALDAALAVDNVAADLAGDEDTLVPAPGLDGFPDLEDDVTLPELTAPPLDDDLDALEAAVMDNPDAMAATSPLADWLFAGAPAPDEYAAPPTPTDTPTPAAPTPPLALDSLFGKSEDAEWADASADASLEANTITSLADLLPTPGAASTSHGEDTFWESDLGEDSFIPAPPDEDLLAADDTDTPPTPDLDLSSDVLAQLNADLLGLEGLPPEAWQPDPLDWPGDTDATAPQAPSLDSLFEDSQTSATSSTDIDAADVDAADTADADRLDSAASLGEEAETADEAADLLTALGSTPTPVEAAAGTSLADLFSTAADTSDSSEFQELPALDPSPPVEAAAQGDEQSLAADAATDNLAPAAEIPDGFLADIDSDTSAIDTFGDWLDQPDTIDLAAIDSDTLDLAAPAAPLADVGSDEAATDTLRNWIDQSNDIDLDTIDLDAPEGDLNPTAAAVPAADPDNAADLETWEDLFSLEEPVVEDLAVEAPEELAGEESEGLAVEELEGLAGEESVEEATEPFETTPVESDPSSRDPSDRYLDTPLGSGQDTHPDPTLAAAIPTDTDTPAPEASTANDWDQWQQLAADSPLEPSFPPQDMLADLGSLLGDPAAAAPPVDFDRLDQLGAAFDLDPDPAPEAVDLSSWDDLSAAFGEETADAPDRAADLSGLEALQDPFPHATGEEAPALEGDLPPTADRATPLDDLLWGDLDPLAPTDIVPGADPETAIDTLDDWAIAFGGPDLPTAAPTDEDIHLSLEGMSFELDLPPIPPLASPAPPSAAAADLSLSSAGLLGELMGTDHELSEAVDEPPPASPDFGWDELGASLEPDLPPTADRLVPDVLEDDWGASLEPDIPTAASEGFSLGDLHLDLDLGADLPSPPELARGDEGAELEDAGLGDADLEEFGLEDADLGPEMSTASSEALSFEDLDLNLDVDLGLEADTPLSPEPEEPPLAIADLMAALDGDAPSASATTADRLADFDLAEADPLGFSPRADGAAAPEAVGSPADRQEIDLFPTATDEAGVIDEVLDLEDDALRDLFPPTGFAPSPLGPEAADPDEFDRPTEAIAAIEDFLSPDPTPEPETAPWDEATLPGLDIGDDAPGAAVTETTATTAALLAIADHSDDDDATGDGSEDGEWFLGIDLGTTGLSAVLMNRSDGQAYPLYWTDNGLAGATTETIFRYPTSVSLAKTGTGWTVQAVGSAALTLVDWTEADGAAPLLVHGLKPLLATGIPHPDDHGNSQPYVQWSDRHPLPLSALLSALQGLLATMQVPEAPAVTAPIGAAGLTLGALATALKHLQGVVVGYPAQGSDTYRLNVREAVLQAPLVADPSQIFFVDEAIAAILSGLPDPHHIPDTASSQTQTLYQCNWQGGTVVVSAGASATELGLVDLPHPLAALTAEDFALRTLAYGGDALDLDIISHLLVPPERRQRRPIGSNRATTTGWHWEATLPEDAEVHWESLGLEHLDLPRLAEPDRDARIRLRRRLESSPLGQSLLEAARHLKLILQNQAQFHLELGDQSWRVLRRDLENRILVPYIQRINQNLNGLMSQTGLSAQGIKQVICTGGNASFGTIAKWLRQKFPNATIIQDTYPTQRPASCSRVAYGLVNLCRYPQVLDGPRHQYSDYFLLHEILRVAPDAPMPLSGLLHLLEEQGVNTEVCQQRVVALLEGHLPPGLVPDATTRSHLSPATLDTALYRALATESLFSHQSGQIYVLNSSHRQRLQQHLANLMADKRQALTEPLMAQLVLP